MLHLNFQGCCIRLPLPLPESLQTSLLMLRLNLQGCCISKSQTRAKVCHRSSRHCSSRPSSPRGVLAASLHVREDNDALNNEMPWAAAFEILGIPRNFLRFFGNF